MKLELKHLAPYLPYDLKLQILEHPFGIIPRNFELDCGHDFNYHLQQGNVKPIIRPLSDLTKEINHNGGKFVPIVELLKIAHPNWYKEKIGNRYSEIEYKNVGWYHRAYFSFMATKDIEIHTGFMQNEPLWKIEKLFEWNFDVFGLIEEGLAIDINTLSVQNDG
jgi:hypothetical protein